MKRSKAFPSKYMSQDDVSDGPIRGTIEVVQPETVGRGDDAEEKAVLYLKGGQKGLVLNGTTWDQITEIAQERGIPEPDDSDNWVGLMIELYHDPSVRFGTKKVGGIRVRKPAAVTRTDTGDRRLDRSGLKRRPAPPPPEDGPEYTDDDAPVDDDGQPF
jgi:hypothetical protein